MTTNNRQIRDRIKELRRVPASELLANPKNWRLHPPAQEKALSSILREVGIADAVIARETDDGLEIINGHLRQRVLGDELVPVLVLDVDAEEATKILLTMDPLSAMATTDSDALVALLGELSDSFEITELLATVGAIETERSDPLEEWTGMPEFDQDDQMSWKRLIVHFNNEEELAAFAKKMRQDVSESTKFIWYKKAKIESSVERRYVQEQQANGS